RTPLPPGFGHAVVGTGQAPRPALLPAGALVPSFLAGGPAVASTQVGLELGELEGGDGGVEHRDAHVVLEPAGEAVLDGAAEDHGLGAVPLHGFARQRAHAALGLGRVLLE